MPSTPDPKSSEPQVLDPALVKYLKRLVTVLTVVMIFGVLSIVALLVSRLQTFGTERADLAPTEQVGLPEKLTLPDGSTATAFTRGLGWYAVVTQDDEILIFDAESGEIKERIQIE